MASSICNQEFVLRLFLTERFYEIVPVSHCILPITLRQMEKEEQLDTAASWLHFLPLSLLIHFSINQLVSYTHPRTSNRSRFVKMYNHTQNKNKTCPISSLFSLCHELLITTHFATLNLSLSPLNINSLWTLLQCSADQESFPFLGTYVRMWSPYISVINAL
jgi:hypothetical protein